ncbi:uncharacterized protein Tco025E_03118 [Trypanosoma conorhini]|uniref:Uncharacterized protein n=1 Tax=Trypanosoma conorhini TaxID=83891 RepID=A0A422PYI6_9TRYP|nr:uncharacterized protein Tco025E_03118 [Trypanosoma conorhini]RNF22803.1 hypothetical protein Tco025E_03118 [Trypanosoma conorhini]
MHFLWHFPSFFSDREACGGATASAPDTPASPLFAPAQLSRFFFLRGVEFLFAGFSDVVVLGLQGGRGARTPHLSFLPSLSFPAKVFLWYLLRRLRRRQMEGNFYISGSVIKRELRSNYGRLYAKCREEAAAYGRCIEAGQVNRNLAQGLCGEERRALRACVDAQGAALKQQHQQATRQ